MPEFDDLFEDADVKAIALPSTAHDLGYSLTYDGSLYTGKNGDDEVIGQWTDEQEARKAVLNAAIAEVNAIDLERPWTEEDTESLEMLAS